MKFKLPSDTSSLLRKATSRRSGSGSLTTSSISVESNGIFGSTWSLEQRFRDFHYVNISARAHSELPLETRTVGCTEHEETFLGSQLVYWLRTSKMCGSLEEAMHVASKMLIFGLISRIDDPLSEIFVCSLSPYRFNFEKTAYEEV
eukprot:CAMPEP_0185850716 /NCGR_PEP_ID=MMETSP1354-20130828/4752_1 /TAXON_ID=708628 /ORGANISM="Erythrolobus madagascarensis, Strain CCMP3276" /LENGTH=145 /DNA_ID=CAMNT_0028551429 /DNA_START=140 /DNA_END=577 /DNA_ORIENTATION=+